MNFKTFIRFFVLLSILFASTAKAQLTDVAVATNDYGSGRVVMTGQEIFSGTSGYFSKANHVNFFENMLFHASHRSTAGKVAILTAYTVDPNLNSFQTEMQNRGWQISVYTDDASINTLTAMQAFDVILIVCDGNGGAAQMDDATFNTNVRSYVNTGGGLVVSGWFCWKIGQSSIFGNMLNAISPYTGLTSTYLYTPSYNLTQEQPSHPIYNNVSLVSWQNYGEFPGTGSLRSGATIVAKYATYAAISASSNSPLCTGATLNFTAAGGVSYAWTGPNGFSSSSQNPTRSNVSVADAGTYTCVITRSDASTLNMTVNVVISAPPSTANAGADFGVNSASSSFALAAVAPTVGTGAWTYVSGPNTPSIATPSSATSNVTGFIPGTYVFKWTVSNGTCSSSNDLVNVTVSATPTITSLSPNPVTAGQNLTISGTNFTGATSVTIGGVTVPFTVVGATSITVTVPLATVSGKVVVTTPGGSADGTVQIGSNTTANSTTGWTNAWQTLTTTNAGYLKTVTLKLGNSHLSNSYGLYLELHSTDADPSAANPQFKFNSLVETSATTTVANNTALGEVVFTFAGTTKLNASTTYFIKLKEAAGNPSGTGNQSIAKNSSGTDGAAGNNFGTLYYKFSMAPVLNVIYPKPTITNLSPNPLTSGQTLTISGTNFTGATNVTIGGVTVPFTVVGATSITVVVPLGTVSGKVTVTTPGGTADGEVQIGANTTALSSTGWSGAWQTLSTTSAGYLKTVTLKLANSDVSNAYGLYLELHSTDANPSSASPYTKFNSLVTSSATTTVAANTSAGEVNFNFTNSPLLAANTNYYVVLKAASTSPSITGGQTIYFNYGPTDGGSGNNFGTLYYKFTVAPNLVVRNYPTISSIINQMVLATTPTSALPFTVGDVETAPQNLVVTATSSDTNLIPNANIVLGGSGANRTATVTAANNRFGTATITLTVTDEMGLSTTTTFTVEVKDPTCNSFTASDFILNGNSSRNNSVITLTPNAGAQSGSVWNKYKIYLDKDFDIQAKVYLGSNDGGADGLAFVLQNQSVNAGSSGGGLGYAGISPSFAVEFDTYNNGSQEPVGDHIAIIKNGLTAGNHSVYASPYVTEMEDGAWHNVEFKWNALSKNFQVWYEGVKRFDITEDLKANIFNNANYVYWGFAAATGGMTNLQQVDIPEYCLVKQVRATPLAGTNNASAATTFCAGADVVLEADYSASYQWFKDGSPILNATQQAITVSTSGSYTVRATSVMGNVSESEPIVVTANPIPTVNQPSNVLVQNGTATPTITFTGAVSPATYAWTNSNTSFGLAANGTGTISSFTANYTGGGNVQQVVSNIVVTPSANGCVGTPKTFTFTVNLNAPPTNISLSKANLFEANALGATVGNLSTTDPDLNDTHTYTLVNGSGAADNASFVIVGNVLKANVVFNYANKRLFAIRVRTTDAGGLAYEKEFLVSISKLPVVTGTGNKPSTFIQTPASTNPSISKGYSSHLQVTGDNLVAYAWSSGASLSAANTSNPVATPAQTTTYYVTVTNTYGSTTVLPITVTVLTDYNVTPANILTPNGDGENDTWFVENLNSYPNNQVKVFDKAGRLVFSQSGYANTWDASNLVPDTYYYIIIFGPEVAPKKGFITVVK